MERGQNINIKGSWEEVNSNPNGWFWGVQDLVEEVTADAVEIAREIELEVEPEGETELLQSHDKTLMHKEFLLMDEQRKWVSEMKSIPGEDTVKIIKMTKKDLDYYINWVDKAAWGLERTNYNFDRCYFILRNRHSHP